MKDRVSVREDLLQHNEARVYEISISCNIDFSIYSSNLVDFGSCGGEMEGTALQKDTAGVDSEAK